MSWRMKRDAAVLDLDLQDHLPEEATAVPRPSGELLLPNCGRRDHQLG